MNAIEILLERNATYASQDFKPGLKMMPSLRTTVIGCVDPRVDPFDIFNANPGEMAVIRNVGCRIYPSTFQTMGMLRIVTKAQGAETGPGWNLIVLHHTDCGINCLVHSPEMLAKHFGVGPTELGPMAITDPAKSVAYDVTILKAAPTLSAGLSVTGMVYGVESGRVKIVVPTAQIRSDGPA